MLINNAGFKVKINYFANVSGGRNNTFLKPEKETSILWRETKHGNITFFVYKNTPE